jgi:hypothetical protein
VATLTPSTLICADDGCTETLNEMVSSRTSARPGAALCGAAARSGSGGGSAPTRPAESSDAAAAFAGPVGPVRPMVAIANIAAPITTAAPPPNSA